MIAIEQLFALSEFSRIAYPLRIVARQNNRRSSDARIAFLISVPKKRLRHAVDRVTMRRRTREAYRLNHRNYALPEGLRLDVAFVYVADSLSDYGKVEKAMCRLLEALSKKYMAADEESC